MSSEVSGRHRPRVPGVLLCAVVVAALVAVVAAVVLSGGSATVSADDLARAVDDRFADRGRPAAAARCPEDLPDELGRSVRCTATVNGQVVDVVATVTAADGAAVGYDLRPEARPVARALLDRQVAEFVTGRAGSPATASCAGDLPPVPGRQVPCTVNLTGETFELAVTAEGVDEGLVRFTVEEK